MVICLELGADLHIAQLMPLLVTVSCFSKIQIGFAFLVPAHPGSPGKAAVKRVCVCVCVIQPAFRSIANFWHILGTLLINQLTDDLSANLSCTVNELK